jgi:hypothetical protein
MRIALQEIRQGRYQECSADTLRTSNAQQSMRILLAMRLCFGFSDDVECLARLRVVALALGRRNHLPRRAMQ